MGQVGLYLLLQRFSNQLDQIDRLLPPSKAGMGIKLKIPILMDNMVKDRDSWSKLRQACELVLDCN